MNKLGNLALIIIGIFLTDILIQSNMQETPSPNKEGSSTTQEEAPYVESAENSQYYYEQLSNSQKEIYNLLKRECFQFHSNIRLNYVHIKDLTIASYALRMDYPSLFWINEYHYRITKNDLVTEIEFSIPKDIQTDLASIDDIVNQIIVDMNSLSITNDYEKLKYFYDWIIENTEYETNASSQDMRSVFLQKASVCAGYSRAFQYLCQKANMECTYVSGHTNTNESHAWNLVKLSDKYYWVDVTWGDPVYAGEQDNETNYNYFLVNDEEFLKTHMIENEDGTNFTFPNCTDDSLNYYRWNHSYFDEYDAKNVSQYFREKFQNNVYKDIELKFKNKESYNAFLYQHLQKKDAIIYDDIKAENPFFYGTMHVSYSMIESANYVKINVELN